MAIDYLEDQLCYSKSIRKGGFRYFLLVYFMIFFAFNFFLIVKQYKRRHYSPLQERSFYLTILLHFSIIINYGLLGVIWFVYGFIKPDEIYEADSLEAKLYKLIYTMSRNNFYIIYAFRSIRLWYAHQFKIREGFLYSFFLKEIYMIIICNLFSFLVLGLPSFLEPLTYRLPIEYSGNAISSYWDGLHYLELFIFTLLLFITRKMDVRFRMQSEIFALFVMSYILCKNLIQGQIFQEAQKFMHIQIIFGGFFTSYHEFSHKRILLEQKATNIVKILKYLEIFQNLPTIPMIPHPFLSRMAQNFVIIKLVNANNIMNAIDTQNKIDSDKDSYCSIEVTYLLLQVSIRSWFMLFFAISLPVYNAIYLKIPLTPKLILDKFDDFIQNEQCIRLFSLFLDYYDQAIADKNSLWAKSVSENSRNNESTYKPYMHKNQIRYSTLLSIWIDFGMGVDISMGQLREYIFELFESRMHLYQKQIIILWIYVYGGLDIDINRYIQDGNISTTFNYIRDSQERQKLLNIKSQIQSMLNIPLEKVEYIIVLKQNNDKEAILQYFNDEGIIEEIGRALEIIYIAKYKQSQSFQILKKQFNKNEKITDNLMKLGMISYD